jgi:hypothetical protein
MSLHGIAGRLAQSHAVSRATVLREKMKGIEANIAVCEAKIRNLQSAEEPSDEEPMDNWFEPTSAEWRMSRGTGVEPEKQYPAEMP